MVNCRRYALLTSVLLLASGSAEAAILFSYDLDSLVYLSTDIVEGTLVGPDERPVRNPDLVEISAVYKGELSPGSRIPIRGIPFCQMPAGGEFGELSLLESGMRVILFLQPVDREFDRSAPRDAVKLVWSGVKVLRDGRVLGFSQHYGNPGPYVLETPQAFKGHTFPPVEEFRRQLAGSLDAMDALRERLESDAVPEDVPWLMELLQTRRSDRVPFTRPILFGRRDHIAELICSRLASLHMPEVLEQGLRLDLWYDCRWILAEGFGTPAGREFLIRRIEDANLPLEQRVRYAGILDDAGADYFSGPRRSSRPQETQSSGNANYIMRIARVALSERKNEQLSLELLKSLDSFARSSAQRREPAVHEDLMQAAEALVTLYGQTTSHQLKHRAEMVIARIDRKARERLGSTSGPILSAVLPNHPEMMAGGTGRTLACRFETLSLDGGGWSNASVVLHREATGDEYVLTFDLRWDQRYPGVAGMRMLNLPADLPQGRYRVYLRFWRGDQVVSDGYPFETDL